MGVLRRLNLGEAGANLAEFEEMRIQMELLRKEKQVLEERVRRIEHEERMVHQNVDLEDKLALKKLVVMLKMKNDRLSGKTGQRNKAKG